MAEHDDPVLHAQRTRRAHIFEVARPQELRPDHAHQRRPAKKDRHCDQQPETSTEDREKDDDDVKRRRAAPDLDDPLEDKVGAPAEIALHRTGDDPQNAGPDRNDQREQDRKAEAVDDPRQHVARRVVGAQQMIPVGRRGRDSDVVDRVVAVGHRGPDRPSRHHILARVLAVGRILHHPFWVVEAIDDSAGRDQALHFRVAIDRLGLEVAAERGFRIEPVDRKMQVAAIADNDRLVVRQDLREQRKAEKRREYPQGPVGAAVGLEVAPPALVQRRQTHHPILRSKSMRGSTKTYIRSDTIPITSPIRPKA